MKPLFSVYSRLLETFLAAADEGAFSAAAVRLGLTQSAVTKQIRKLEGELGVELFDRTRRPLVLTEEGVVLRREALSCRERLFAAAEDLRRGSFLKPQIRIGAIDLLTRWLIPELVKNLLPLASGITATTGTSPQLLESLQKRDIDLAFVTGAFSEVQGVARALIYEDDAVVVLPAALAAQKKGPWSWDDLRFCGLPLIRFVREGGGGRLNESFISTLGFDFPQRIEVDNNSTMLSLVEKGVGWALVVSSVFRQYPDDNGRLYVQRLPDAQLKHAIYLISREREMPETVEAVAAEARKIALKVA